jgi:ribosomal protein S6
MEKETDDKVYELGYHLLPTLSEGDVSVEVAALKALIEKRGGTIIADEAPKLTDLSYTMTKAQSGKISKFTTAHFGWVKFEMTPAQAMEIKTELESHQQVLRYLLIATVRESTMAPRRMVAGVREVTPTTTLRKLVKEEAQVPVSEAELDKTIEELVGEKL